MMKKTYEIPVSKELQHAYESIFMKEIEIHDMVSCFLKGKLLVPVFLKGRELENSSQGKVVWRIILLYAATEEIWHRLDKFTRLYSLELEIEKEFWNIPGKTKTNGKASEHSGV